MAGGWLFDAWREPGPFVAYGILAFVMVAAALLVLRSTGKVDPGDAEPEPVAG